MHATFASDSRMWRACQGPSTRWDFCEIFAIRFLWYNIEHLWFNVNHLWYNVKHLWYNVKHLRTTPNKISRKSHRVDVFCTTSNIREILFDDVSWRWCMPNIHETLWNKISWKPHRVDADPLIKHLWDFHEIFARRCFDEFFWLESTNIVKHHETTSNKISRKSHRVDGPSRKCYAHNWRTMCVM
jgi:hypothetical protein